MSVITKATWPTCPTCKKPYDEVMETTDAAGAHTVSARCHGCHRRDQYRLVLQLVEPRRTGFSGGAIVPCEICGLEYEMLRDQVTHKPCPGPQYKRQSTITVVANPADRPTPVPDKPAEEKKEPEAEGSRFSWLEVD